MKAYPHAYHARADTVTSGTVEVGSTGVPELTTAPPPEFDGPGGAWSPETLLMASIADCFILTFRGGARAARLEWDSLEALVEGTLERTNGATQFTRYVTRAVLTLKSTSDQEKAKELLDRAEKICLVANSLRGARLLEATVKAGAS